MKNELTHHGILGMKWGVRRTPAQLGRTMITTQRQLTADKVKLERLNSGKHLSIGFTKKRQAVYDKRDKTALEKRIDLNEQRIANREAKKSEKALRKQTIAKTYQDIDRQTSIGDKLVYNNATRKQAAKYVVDRNMTVSEATKKAKGNARRNAAIFVAAYGAVAYATLKRMN